MFPSFPSFYVHYSFSSRSFFSVYHPCCPARQTSSSNAGNSSSAWKKETWSWSCTWWPYTEQVWRTTVAGPRRKERNVVTCVYANTGAPALSATCHVSRLPQRMLCSRPQMVPADQLLKSHRFCTKQQHTFKTFWKVSFFVNFLKKKHIFWILLQIVTGKRTTDRSSQVGKCAKRTPPKNTMLGARLVPRRLDLDCVFCSFFELLKHQSEKHLLNSCLKILCEQK